MTLLFREKQINLTHFDVKKRVSLFIGEFFAYRGETKQARSTFSATSPSIVVVARSPSCKSSGAAANAEM